MSHVKVDLKKYKAQDSMNRRPIILDNLAFLKFIGS